MTLPQIGQIDPRDVGNGYYPYLRRVGPTDLEFLDIIAWLQLRGAPKDVTLVADNDGWTGKPLPARVRFSIAGSPDALKNNVLDGSNSLIYNEDALQMYNFPDNTLIGLKVFFKFGDPSVREFYPGLRQTVGYVVVDPIGIEWPSENGFHGSRVDNMNTFPEGAKFTRADGTYEKIGRRFAFFNIEPVWRKVG